MSPKISQELDHFAKLLDPNSHANPQQIAAETIKINELAHTVMNKAARDLEELLKAPIEDGLSILKAAEHYEKNPSELETVIQTLWRHKDAFKTMLAELSILSEAMIKNPSAPGASAPGA